ncbi:hypothetical protein RHSIM_Rhsim06G0111100 [Rhododendron simsii]|uniref:Uncharacterized protein n=1 Tax=Rhododendron simsii TaxID=118357 RepID=A0A834LKD6_RHOSS|nr:hypothetical protein RHSIM_Rhsim06G0111100 [Rhododendron simsii]
MGTAPRKGWYLLSSDVFSLLCSFCECGCCVVLRYECSEGILLAIDFGKGNRCAIRKIVPGIDPFSFGLYVLGGAFSHGYVHCAVINKVQGYWKTVTEPCSLATKDQSGFRWFGSLADLKHHDKPPNRTFLTKRDLLEGLMPELKGLVFSSLQS